VVHETTPALAKGSLHNAVCVVRCTGFAALRAKWKTNIKIKEKARYGAIFP
jgi:hypothetical protein